MSDVQKARDFLSRCIVETESLDISDRKPYYVVVTPSGKYTRVSEEVHAMIQALVEGHDIQHLQHVLEQRTGKHMNAREMEAWLQNIVDRLERIDGSRSRNLLNDVWVKMDVVPAYWTMRFVRYLGVLFERFTVVSVLPVALLVCGTTMWETKGVLGQLNSGAYALGVLLGLVSVLIHELGHASAAYRYGARVGAIGAGFYLYYPIMYSDVTDVWKLRRRQRGIVDIAGVYFQVIVAALYAVLYQISGWPAFVVGLWTIAGSVFMSLNPVLKFDGYWMLSDIFGVTNLSTVPFRMLNYVMQRLQGRTPKELPWSRRLSVLLGIYSIFYFAVWLLVLIFLASFIFGVVRDLMSMWYKLFARDSATLSWSWVIEHLLTTSREEWGKFIVLALVLYFAFKQGKILISLRKLQLNQENKGEVQKLREVR